MKRTRANVAEWALARSLEPVQIDGIPEGFSFREPEITINGKDSGGDLVAYVPLTEHAVYGKDELELLTEYKKHV